MTTRTRRYLGLELAGARNLKTTLATIEHYPKENKIFLLNLHEGLGSDDDLIEQIRELASADAVIGVNVSLELPPCITCTRKSCLMPAKCTVPAVKWMRSIEKSKPLTPYTQRPVELWLRNEVLPTLPPEYLFDLDETLGGSRAPLTARMHFLKPHLKGLKIVEALPKLTIAVLANRLKLESRIVAGYRRLEEGAFAREKILDALCEQAGIFIYQKDLLRLSEHLATFDAFICAYTALLNETERTHPVPRGFPEETGWIRYPEQEEA